MCRVVCLNGVVGCCVVFYFYGFLCGACFCCCGGVSVLSLWLMCATVLRCVCCVVNVLCFLFLLLMRLCVVWIL